MRSAPVYTAHSHPSDRHRDKKAGEKRLSEVANFTSNQPQHRLCSLPLHPKRKLLSGKRNAIPFCQTGDLAWPRCGCAVPLLRVPAARAGAAVLSPGLTTPARGQPRVSPAASRPWGGCPAPAGQTSLLCPGPPEKPPQKTPSQWRGHSGDNPERLETAQRPTFMSPPPLRAGV